MTPKTCRGQRWGKLGQPGKNFLIGLLESSLSAKQLKTQPVPRPESSQWASAEVEPTRRVLVRYKMLAWVSADHSTREVAEGSFAESSTGHGDSSPSRLGTAQPKSDCLWCWRHLLRWVEHKSYCQLTETAFFIFPERRKRLGREGRSSIWFFFFHLCFFKFICQWEESKGEAKVSAAA